MIKHNQENSCYFKFNTLSNAILQRGFYGKFIFADTLMRKIDDNSEKIATENYIGMR